MLRNLDLVALILALPVFVLVDAPIVGYVTIAAAWIIGRIAIAVSARRRAEALRQGNRNAALGVTAFAVMGRIWLIAGAILLVGLLAEREAGLAAAVLALILVTISLVTSFVAQILDPEVGSSPKPDATQAPGAMR